MYGICNLAMIPLRSAPGDRNEQVSQVLFGEHFEVIEVLPSWVKIRLQYDQYEGWIDQKQYREISTQDFENLSESALVLNGDLIEYVSGSRHELMPIPLGSSVSFLNFETINSDQFEFEGLRVTGKKDKQDLLKTAFLYLNAPYLWGGKTPFGIDCSGFTQMVYKLNGCYLHRDAKDQATQGEVLSFIEESEPGDLAFFDNEEGIITHVGIMMQDNYIIHASGRVRIDRIDHLGIFNAELKKHTHRLRVIKRIF
jgi:gamma-D-glutamyl-L-lysine dipeptidyl-peptidase